MSSPTMKYSYGIILKCQDRYLIVQNRDSEAFIYFFFANIQHWKEYRFKQLFSSFSVDEKERLLYMPFHDIYMDLYVNHVPAKHHNKYLNAEKNYNYLHNHEHLLNLLKQSFHRPIPWIFPKGRIETGETEVDCAIREFHEETCLSLDLSVVDVNKYIEYKQYKRFYHFELTTKLFIVEVPNILKIKYQRFDGLIRTLSVSNEILFATWAREDELKHYLYGTLYYSLRKYLSENHNRLVFG